MIAQSVVSSRCGFLHHCRPTHRNVLRSVLLSAALGLCALSVGQSSRADELFIGDGGDSSVKYFDASSGAYLGAFVAAGSAGSTGPQG
jgi:hypothetical protein